MTGSRAAARAGALGLVAALSASGCWVERVPPEERRDAPVEREEPADEIRSSLDSSEAGWNRGEIAAFLSPYRRSDSTTYVGSDGLRAGFARLRERYAPLFADGAERDSLRFSDLRVRSLGEGHALSIGRYTLRRRDSVTGTGWFSLVWERVRGRWRIVHDHSSAVPLSPDGGP